MTLCPVCQELKCLLVRRIFCVESCAHVIVCVKSQLWFQYTIGCLCSVPSCPCVFQMLKCNIEITRKSCYVSFQTTAAAAACITWKKKKSPVKDRLGVSFVFKHFKFPLNVREQRNQEMICTMKICQSFAGFAWTLNVKLSWLHCW